MNIAIIVQRYGRDLVGGSELHSRIIARMLKRQHNITVITTCARDYITWENHYPEGESVEDDIRVIRFRVERARDIEQFNRYSEAFFSGQKHTESQEREWIEAQGPYAPAMIEYIRGNINNYDTALFYTYLYYPVVYGLEHAKRAVLIPTFHPEKPAGLEIYKKVLPMAKGFIFNTAEERNSFKRYGFLKTDDFITEGIPVDTLISMKTEDTPAGTDDPEIDIQNTRYFLYSGRIDKQKGFFDILEYHTELSRHHVLGREKLIATGSGRLDIEDESVIYLGFVSERLKYDLIKNAVAVLVPSYLESLSIIALEAFYHGIPVIGRESCGPVMGHIRKGNAGLPFSDFNSYRDSVVRLLSDRYQRRKLGENALDYVNKFYTSDRILKSYNMLFDRVTGHC